MAVSINIMIFWDVTPCILVHRYQITFHKTAICSKYELTAAWKTLNHFDRGYSDVAVISTQ
jgi:predicted solute-binding protein